MVDPNSNDLISAVQNYLAQGLVAFPVRCRSKKPHLSNWQHLTVEDCRALWHGVQASNVGVLLGLPSGDGNFLIDLDIDDHEAGKLASYIFPKTASFGRGNGIRHCLFFVDEVPTYQRIPLPGPNGDKGFLEIRGKGQQTIFPPSVHSETGEEIRWINPVDPQVIPLQLLLDKIRLFAALTILFKHWPPAGSRNDYALAVSGILTKSSLVLIDHPEIVSVLARLAGDEEADKRPSLSAAKSKLDQGGKVAGMHALGRHLGTDLANTVLGLIASAPSKQTNAELPPIDGGEDAFDLNRHLISAKELALKDIPERQFFIEPWLPHGSLSMLYAARGVGKTWLATSIALSVSNGHDFLHFKSGGARKVLFVDGEMTISDLQARLCGMSHNAPANLSYLPSENLFRAGCPLNICNPDHQLALNTVSDEFFAGEDGLIVLDNLSTLSGGVNENDNSEQEALLQWMVLNRHLRRSILLVHHAGKSGDQRGASRREDMLDTVIKLEEVKDPLQRDPTSAQFKLVFTKSRQQRPQPFELDLKLIEQPDGTLGWGLNSDAPVHDQIKILRAIHDLKPKTQSELAAKIADGEVPGLTISKTTVNRHVQHLKDKGAINKGINGFEVTTLGISKLAEFFPADFDDPYKDVF